MGRVVNIREFLSAVFLAIIGLLFCGGAYMAGIGSPANPGEGFMPLVAGAALFLLSLALLFQRTCSKKISKERNPFWPEKGSQIRVAAVLASILIYTFVFEWIGFALATFILFLFLLKTIDPVSWRNAFFISLLTTVAGFFLFQVWLQVQLPEGWISWWRISQWIF